MHRLGPLLMLVAALALPLAGPPRAHADAAQAPERAHAAPAPDARVDINHASLEELLKVPGMTATWARRILRFRPYRSKIDLLDRGVLSSAAYDRVKDYVIAHRTKE